MSIRVIERTIMDKLKYTPDDDIPVHEEGAINLICKPFQSHENGLPEWIKNAADEYARSNTPLNERVILLILNDGKGETRPTISCLDFSGMTSRTIEHHFRIWADPDAATRGQKTNDVQGGHGNGGKCYMTQMFDDYSAIFTVSQNKGNRYGVIGGSIKFGYIPNKNEGRDFIVSDVQYVLKNELIDFSVSIDDLPSNIRNVFNSAIGFTHIFGVGPKGYKPNLPVKTIIVNLQSHPQMIRNLELCNVYVVANGKVLNDGSPFSLPVIEPMDEAKEPRILDIPQYLRDPVSKAKIKTYESEEECGKLVLKTSKANMRYQRRRGRHNVIFKSSSGIIGYKQVRELDIQSSYKDKIYGECILESLDKYKQNDRSRLANSPLTSAVERFISAQIENYAREFEKLDRRKYDQKEKNAISKINEALDKWKNRFLSDYMRGLWGSGVGSNPPYPPSLPSGKPVRIDISLTHHLAGVGVSFRPIIRFYDSEGKQIRSTPFRWISEDTNVALVNEDLGIISTYTMGNTLIYAETLDGKITSNKIPLEVINICEVEIFPKSLNIPLGSRKKLKANCKITNGDLVTGVYLIWTESNPNIARVSSSGLVYGFTQGETSIVAGDDYCMSSEPANIHVTESIGSGKGDKRGKGFPVILVSGEIDKDPETNEYVFLGSDHPPVYQRPQDVERNIWWINSSSPLAKLYLNNEKYGYESREWRIYHLERIIDVIVQIALTHGPSEDESISVNEWIMRWGGQVAEIQEAAVSDLANFIQDGELPE